MIFTINIQVCISRMKLVSAVTKNRQQYYKHYAGGVLHARQNENRKFVLN